MPDLKFFTREAAMEKATDIKAALALSKLRFFKSTFAPTAWSTKAELVAEEVAFDGYTAGGYTLTAWTGPVFDPDGGALITSPIVNVAYGPAEAPPVTGLIGGYWIEDAAGGVRVVVKYADARSMGAVGDGFPWVEQMVEGRNP